MKRLLLIIATLLFLAPFAQAEDCTCVWGSACNCPMKIFDFATGKQPYTSTIGASDCFLVKDNGGKNAPAANPALVVNEKVWWAGLTATEAQFTKASYWCLSATDAYLFQPITIRTEDPPNGVLQACGGCAATEVKLATTEVAGDATLKESWFYAQKGAGAGQTVRICNWVLSTKILTLCEAPATAFDNTTYYTLIASANPLTAQARKQQADALGLDGDKVTSTGGVLQAMYDLQMDVDGITSQFVFTVPGKVDASTNGTITGSPRRD